MHLFPTRREAPSAWVGLVAELADLSTRLISALSLAQDMHCAQQSLRSSVVQANIPYRFSSHEQGRCTLSGERQHLFRISHLVWWWLTWSIRHRRCKFRSCRSCENHARKMRTFFTRRLEPKTKSSNAFKWSLRPKRKRNILKQASAKQGSVFSKTNFS